MSKDFLNEREFELINIVGGQLAVNQRDLSRQMNLSLGMTNMLVRRLIAKGCIRIQQLNQRKVRYLLTPKGFSEKMRKSVKYTLKTIGSIGLIRRRLDAVIGQLHTEGERHFWILGGSDLAELVEIALSQPQWMGATYQRVEQIPVGPVHGTVLVCQEKPRIPVTCLARCIDLIEELAKSGPFINHGTMTENV